MTHHFGWDQRMVVLSFAASAADPAHTLVVTAPADGFVAPPGYYLMFVNATAARIPSLGAFVRVL